MWHGQGSPLFDVVNPVFSLPSTVSPTLQGVLKDGFGEAVAACDMSEPCKIPSLDSCQKKFLWIHKEVDLAPHPDVGLVLQAGDRRSFLVHLVSKAWIFFFSLFFFSPVSMRGPCLTIVEEGGGDKRLSELESSAYKYSFPDQIVFLKEG